MIESDSLEHQVIDEQYNFTMTDDNSNSRCLYPSIVNKSSIHIFQAVDNALSQPPAYPENTQKLNLSKNMLSVFPQQFQHLKQVDLSRNKIERIPIEINQISSLVILRMNYNNVTTLPFLKWIRHLQLYHNPIKVITTKLTESHLQFLVFDWVPYLMHPSKSTNQSQSFQRICLLLQKADIEQFTQFIEFDKLFQENVKLTKYPISYFLHKSIYRQNQFFIDYMITYHNNLNFNSIKYMDRYILEEVLEEEYSPALTLFTLKKSNLNDNQVFLFNLMLACQYSNLTLFNFIVANISKRSLIAQHSQQVIEAIIKHFNEAKGSGNMLTKIMKCAGFSQNNKKKFELPEDQSFQQSQCIGDAILYIYSRQQLKEAFFWQKQIVSELPLLHFAVGCKKPELLQILLKNNFSVFSENLQGKKAKNIRGSIICRKILIKHEKKARSSLLLQNSDNQSGQQKQQKEKKWFHYIFHDEPVRLTPKSAHRNKKQSAILTSQKIQRLHQLNRNDQKGQKVFYQGSPKKRPRNTLNHLFIPDKDETGIIIDYWMNYCQRNSHLVEKKLQQTTKQQGNINPLNQYEGFHNKILHAVPHCYEKQQTKNSIFPRLFRCTDVGDLEQDKEQQYIVEVTNILHRPYSLPQNLLQYQQISP